MRRASLITIGALAMLGLVGCENPGWNQWDSVSLQNNSDQTIVLRRYEGRTGDQPGTPQPVVTAPPHQAVTNVQALPSGSCYLYWDIVDASDKPIRTIEKICGNDTVVYP
jgi:hypothetical protein